ncbi:zinc finger BED domain-containing protein RICESLEEPER 3-like [Miscanthus floridulus]|uniref:zinc finger BED domain-containing protein RICESLEEPER 3-like n=1 Tax=Miscanthus floridulus TaxID=154761 RepID=UPI003459D65F
MADDDGVVYPLTGNDDLIAAGLLPENDDDIYDDATALLGIDVGSGSAPIDLDGGDGGGGAEPAPSATATGTPVSSNSTDGTSCFGKRKSSVWVNFDEIYETLNGQKVRTAAICKMYIWSGNAKEDYISVVAHYVNADWKLQKRVIGLRLIEVKHSGKNIAERIPAVVEEYCLIDKIFSVTLDNVSSNARAMNTLTPLFACYLDPDPSPDPLDPSNRKYSLEYYNAKSVRPRKFGLYMDVRYNSIYLMLKHLVPYKNVFSVFINSHYGSQLLTTNHWYFVEKLLEFLELFYDSTVDIPLLYSYAFILDPRAKISGFFNVLQLLDEYTSSEYSSYYADVKTELYKLFNKYESKSGAARSQRVAQPSHHTGKKKQAWERIFGRGSGIVGASPLPATSSSSTAISELSAYLDSDNITSYEDDFDLLLWWRDHKLTFPILSIMARDILSVPVSTVSSESCFSLTGRIIEERWRRLSPETMEMLTCLKDWELGEKREQHAVDNQELKDSF